MQTMFKQSLFLVLTPLVLGLSSGLAQADELEVKAGNVEVSVDNGKVEIAPGAASVKAPSLIDRISNLRIFGNRRTNSTGSHTSSGRSDCEGSSSGYSTTNSSGTGVSRSSSSSTTITCN